jgi:capsular exopolysaccharide synthesis family protein
VLIVDADMRRPCLHTIFGLENQYGLSTILADDKESIEIDYVIQWHQPTGLHVLPAGPIPHNAAELIGSMQMSMLLLMLQSRFTHVVIDSPPIVSFTDGVLLSSVVDGVILVVHGGKSSRELVRRSRQVLEEAGARILGVVLNNVKWHSEGYAYYSDSR